MGSAHKLGHPYNFINTINILDSYGQWSASNNTSTFDSFHTAMVNYIILVGNIIVPPKKKT